MRRFLALLLVVMLAGTAVACSDDDGGNDADREESRRDDDDDDEGDDTISGGGFDLDFGGDEDDDLSTEDIIEVVQEFWQERADDVGVDYQPLPDERITAVPGEEPAPTCDGFTITPDDVAGNAFAAPCEEGLTVAWDPNLIDDTLTELFGQAGPAVVFAHEWGHIMQFQSGILDISGQGVGDPPSVLVENQADCLAGAWVAEQVEEEFGPFEDPASLDDSIGAMIFVRDEPGSDPEGELAHGSGFDRVRAFQDGVNQGIEYCFGYIEDPPFIDELPFTNEEDFANQGNLPFDQVTELVVTDLDDYFDLNVEDFDGPDDPFTSVPADELEELHGEIGDGAVATIFGMLWAEVAQDTVGEDLEGEDALFQRACMVGAWLGDILRDQRDGETERPSGAQLSPGDLDEVIITFIELTERAESGEGVAFDAIGQMRRGVFGGIDSCELG